MHASPILSTPAAAPPARGAEASLSSAPLFDACHVGVVLRAVALVALVIAVGAMFGASSVQSWMFDAALLTVGSLPACLVWLIASCSAKGLLSRLPAPVQWAWGIALGGVCGAMATGLVVFAGLGTAPHWVAASFAGALLGGAQVTLLVLRARGRTPAAQTARLAELQARIRPHFLFNTLNSAIALVRREPARAEALLEDLCDLFRQALEERGEAVTLAAELSLAERYLAIEQVRFGPRLRVRWELDPAAESALVPPLMLQPLVENAVLHGVEPSAEGADVMVRTRRRGDRVQIEVFNTVPSGQGRGGHGVALDNVRLRLRLLHDVQSRFSADLEPDGYRVQIEVPA